MCDFIPAGPMLFPSLFCCTSFPMLHRKKYLTEGTSVTSCIGHFKPIQNQVQRRRITLCNEKSKWLAGWNPATQSRTSCPHDLLLNSAQGKKYLKKILQKIWSFPMIYSTIVQGLVQLGGSWLQYSELSGCET